MPPIRRCRWKTQRGMRLVRPSPDCRQLPLPHFCPLSLLMSQGRTCTCKSNYPEICRCNSFEQYPSCPSDCDVKLIDESVQKGPSCCEINASRTSESSDDSRCTTTLISAPTPCERFGLDRDVGTQNDCQMSSNVQTVSYPCDIQSSQTDDPVSMATSITAPPGISPLQFSTTYEEASPVFQNGHISGPGAQFESRYMPCEHCLSTKSKEQNKVNPTTDVLSHRAEPRFQAASYKPRFPCASLPPPSHQSVPHVEPLRESNLTSKPLEIVLRNCSDYPCEIQYNQTPMPNVPEKLNTNRCPSTCRGLHDPSERQNSPNMIRAQSQTQPCAYSNNHTSTSNAELHDSGNCCSTCMDQKTSTYTQSCPASCPPVCPKLTAATSCEDWTNFISALVADKVKSLLNEHSEYDDSCPAKLQSTPNPMPNPHVVEPRDIQTATFISQIADNSINLPVATEETNEDKLSSLPKIPADDICVTATCPKLQDIKTCQCQFPPAFSQYGCTGKIAGTCDCENTKPSSST